MLFIAVVVPVGLFLWYVFMQTGKPPENINGKSILKLSPIFWLVGLACMVISVFFPFYIWISGESTDEWAVVIVLLILFFALGYWLFAYSRSHTVLFDDNEIVVTDMRKKVMRFRWSDIKEVNLNAITSKYILTLKTNERVSVYQYLTGVDEFINRAKNEVRQADG